jgi:hypothetical protein
MIQLTAIDRNSRGCSMSRLWRQQAGTLLLAFITLDVFTLAAMRTVGASLNAGQPATGQLIGLALDGFLVWRIWRGGRVAWTVLLVLTAGLLLLLILAAAWPWSAYLLVMLAILGAQTIILLSPAVRGHLPAGR